MSLCRGLNASCVLALCVAGCNWGQPDPYADAYSGYGSPAEIKFADHVESNTPLEQDLLSLQFTDRQGQVKPLKELAQGKNLVLVMTRGYSGAICPYCSTQVSRLIANYADLSKRNAEVVVVYPLEKPADIPRTDEFVSKSVSMLAAKKEIPFPILLDVELKGVDALGIRKDLSKPATYILDSEGRLQFAYVGNSLADRPSVQAIIEQLDKLTKSSSGS